MIDLVEPQSYSANGPLITLLSDLGTRDAAVTVVKAVLLRHVPDAAFVDISHNVVQYDLQQAAYFLLSAYTHFPKGTVHVVCVDVFSGDAPRMLLAEKDGFFFIAPDNGILPLAFGTGLEHTSLCAEFSKPYVFTDWMNNAGLVIKALQPGNDSLPLTPCTTKEAPRQLQPIIMHDGVECNILYIDRYENVVLDITKPEFNALVKGRPFKIILRKVKDISTISNNYSDVPADEALCRFNDSGFMEIALNRGAAASLLGMEASNIANLRYQTIKIFF